MYEDSPPASGRETPAGGKACNCPFPDVLHTGKEDLNELTQTEDDVLDEQRLSMYAADGGHASDRRIYQREADHHHG